jgi:hypothetical protein
MCLCWFLGPEDCKGLWETYFAELVRFKELEDIRNVKG